MNIKEAKETIQYTLQAYFQKDESGYPLVPLRQQRPILLIGPPGIGKTAIMEQIAGECGAGLVAYTMTHHTRQSAMGLPKIVERTFDDAQVSVTEYTMSEIIASIYACMEKTGKKRGILFLDEINCVSETLAPVMLQLLQDKTFGNQKLPPDWLIVAAGNPPEYNKSVREFDIATLDRVRKIVLEPDLDVWMEYALFHQVHGSIRSYLEAHRDRFYRIRQEDGKKQFVTARGWEDLSAVLKSYEKMGFSVEKMLVEQYLQEEKTAAEFFSYYQIYRKYGQDYRIGQVLDGSLSDAERETITRMAQEGTPQERSMVLAFLLAVLDQNIEQFFRESQIQKVLTESCRQLGIFRENDAEKTFGDWIESREKSLQIRTERELIRREERQTEEAVLKILWKIDQQAKADHESGQEALNRRLEQVCEEETKRCDEQQERISQSLERGFAFLEESYGTGAELTLFVANLTRNGRIRKFLGTYGCPAYTEYEQQLLGGEEVLKNRCCDIVDNH